MTGRPGVVGAFELPVLPPMSAVRDRNEEAAERQQRLREDGYAAGYQSGLDAARAEIDLEIAEHRAAAERLVLAAAALERAARDLDARDRLDLARVEHEMFCVGVEIAVELVGRELAALDEPVREAIARAFALAPTRGQPVVRVHPDDLATALEAIDADLIGPSEATTVAPDPTVERGGCIVDVGDCRVDVQLGPAIDRLRTAVRTTGSPIF